MRKMFLFLTVLGFGVWQARAQWSSPVVLATRQTAPDLDIDPSTGECHVVSVGASEFSTSGVTYTKTDSLGNVLSQEMIPGSEADAGGWCYGPGITVDMNGNPHIGYRRQIGPTDFNTYYVLKAAGHWQGYLQLSNLVSRGYVIRLEADGNNRIHIGRGESVSEPWGNVDYTRIVDQRITKQIPDFQPYRADDRFEIDASMDGKVYLIVGNPDRNQAPVTLFLSDNAGDSFGQGLDIHSSQCSGRNGSPDVFVDATGTAHCCYGTQIDQAVGDKPSVRYVRYEGGAVSMNKAVTPTGALEPYFGGDGWGLGTVAASDDGQFVGIAYLTKSEGDLYFIHSANGGTTWSDPELLDQSVGSWEGRVKPVLRAVRNHFTLVYTSGNEVRLRTYRNAGDEPPIANAGGPYNGLEGTSIVFNGSGSSDIGRNAGIVSYAWDFRNDGTWDAISATPTVSTVYPDAFTGQVRLGVTDRAGRTAEATAAVTVTDVPPTLSIQSARNVREGEVVSFQATVTDPGQDPHTVTWAFGNGASAQGESVSHAFPNDGVYEVTATVTDNKGQSAEASVIVVAANVSPTVNAGGPYSGPAGATIHFEGSATDPGILDLLTFSWDLDGNGSFESTGRNPIRLFPAWGRFLVRLRVTDDGGAMGSDTAVVVIANDTPVVTHVADQVANEGSAFTPLPLDPLVTDPLHRDDEIAWTARGQSSLLASVANRILSVHPLDGDWSGSEWLMLVAEDPRGNRDSTRIRFTVLPVNDPPVWDRHVPPLVLPEDSSASVSVDSLRKWVHDDDHPIDSLSFGVRVGVHFTWSSDPDRRVFVFQPVRDWFGEESVVFVVSDPFGAASFDTCRVRVMEVLEPPGPFALEDPLYFHADAWPDTIRFRWNASHTADPIGVVYYAWTLRQQDGVIDPLRRVVAFDTSLAFIPDPFLGDGVFFWNVEAVDQYEQFQRSDNMGILQIGQASAVPAALEIPTSFGLLQNYPNPFNPETSISFQLPEPAAVRLALYNPVGQEVRVLAEGRKPAGVHTVVWDGRDRREERVPSGVYIYRLEAGNRVLYRKMLLLQ